MLLAYADKLQTRVEPGVLGHARLKDAVRSWSARLRFETDREFESRLGAPSPFAGTNDDVLERWSTRLLELARRGPIQVR